MRLALNISKASVRSKPGQKEQQLAKYRKKRMSKRKNKHRCPQAREAGSLREHHSLIPLCLIGLVGGDELE